jgi:hypothetical protein
MYSRAHLHVRSVQRAALWGFCCVNWAPCVRVFRVLWYCLVRPFGSVQLKDGNKTEVQVSNSYVRRPCAPAVLWAVKRRPGAEVPIASAGAVKPVVAVPKPAKQAEEEDLVLGAIKPVMQGSAAHHFADDVVVSAAEGVLAIIGSDGGGGSSYTGTSAAGSAGPRAGGGSGGVALGAGDKKRMTFKEYLTTH